jgi:hypothetical protein
MPPARRRIKAGAPWRNQTATVKEPNPSIWGWRPDGEPHLSRQAIELEFGDANQSIPPPFSSEYRRNGPPPTIPPYADYFYFGSAKSQNILGHRRALRGPRKVARILLTHFKSARERRLDARRVGVLHCACFAQKCPITASETPEADRESICFVHKNFASKGEQQ